MYRIVFFLPALFLLIAMSFIVYLARSADHRTIRIDCSIAEISPDVPVEAKELCRKARSGRI